MVGGKKIYQTYWPNGSVAQVLRMIKNETPADPVTWEIHEFTLLGKFREYFLLPLCSNGHSHLAVWLADDFVTHVAVSLFS
jgi:hypothetical protein